MSRLSAFGKGRARQGRPHLPRNLTLGGLPAVVLVGMAAIVAGCGGLQAGSGPIFLEMVEYDHYFFDDLASTGDSREMSSDAVKAEIERLATPSWRIARANLIAAGRGAIPRLIANIDRPEPTHVSLRPVPGPTMPEARSTWTLGQVSYSVLRDLVGDYGNFAGPTLPPPEKAAWEEWWRTNRKKAAFYTTEGTIPPHVRKQKNAIVAEAEDRYPGIDPVMRKRLAKHAERERAKEQALREREQKLLEKKRLIAAKQAERARISAERARKAEEAREAEAAARAEDAGEGTPE